MYRLTAEEKSNADILEERFKDSLPCEEDLKQKITQGEKLLNIKIKLAREKLNDEEKEKLQESAKILKETISTLEV